MKRIVIATVCALAVAGALAACGSSTTSNSQSSGAAATTTSSAATAKSSAGTAKGASFVLGNICSCSGAEAADAHAVPAVASAWQSWTNAAGGINGHPVKVITLDDGGVAAKALQDAKELVQQDHVMAIIDDSIADQAFAGYVQSVGVPVTGGISIQAPDLSNPDFFPAGTQVVASVFALTHAAKGAGVSTYGAVYCAEAPDCAQIGQLAGVAAKSDSMGFTSSPVSATAPSYAAPCLNLKSHGVGALYIGLAAPIIPRFTAACAQQGFKPRYAEIIGGLSPSVLTDPNVQGMLVNSGNANPYDSSNPAVAQLQQALKKYAPADAESYSAWATFPWIGGQLFAAAVKAGKLKPSSSPADLKRALYKLHDETLGGLAPPLNYTPGKPAFITCSFNLQIEKQKFTSLNGGKPTCLDPAEKTAVAKIMKAS